MSHLFLLCGIGQALDVRGFQVSEEISKPFTIRLEALSHELLDFDAIVGKPASFAIAGGVSAATPTFDLEGVLSQAAPGALSGIADRALGDAARYVVAVASREAGRLAADVAGRLGGEQAATYARRVAGEAGARYATLAVQSLTQWLRGQAPPGGATVDDHPLGLTRIWNGVVSDLAETRVEPSGLNSYNLTIVPELWLLTQRTNHRVFQRLSAPELAKKILGEWDISPRLNLDESSYPKLDYQVQFAESDFAFLSRTLEDAGISYLFSTTPLGRTELTLTGRPSAAEPIGALPWVSEPSRAMERAFLSRVRVEERVKPGSYALRTTNLRQPMLDLAAAADPTRPDEDPEKGLRWSSFAHSLFDTLILDGDGATPVADDRGAVRAKPRAGEDRAARRRDALRAMKNVLELSSNALDLAPGTRVVIDGHPHADVSAAAPSPRLVVASQVSGSPNAITASAVTTPPEHNFAPPRETPVPSLRGLHTATVVGPGDEEIHTDEFGRIRVQFPWDREGQKDENSSTWVRVAQPWTGAAFGSGALPRVGQEVLVQFLDGDPNKPMVVGSLFNGVNLTPYALPENRTVSTLKTNTSPSADALGFNEIRFNDAALPGKDFGIFLHASNERRDTTHDRTELDHGGRFIYVNGDLDLEAWGNILLQSGAAQDIDIRSTGSIVFNSLPGQAVTPPPPGNTDKVLTPTPPTTPERVAPSLDDVRAKKAELKRGDSGPAVLQLQKKLNAAGYKVPLTGTYDEATEQAVTKFQADKRIQQTGRVGATTLSRLEAPPPPAEIAAPADNNFPGLDDPSARVFPITMPYQGPTAQYGQTFGAPRSGHTHQGVDLTVPVEIQDEAYSAHSFPVLAYRGGVVTQSEHRDDYGIVKIQHDDGTFARYLHNWDTVVEEGQRVKPGQLIAWMGGRGPGGNESYAPHSHFELRDAGDTPYDPQSSILDGSLNPRGDLVVYTGKYGRPRSSYSAR